MEANELMIGDWVYYSSKKHIVQVVGISGIRYSFNQQDVILYGDCFKDFDGRGRWELHTTKSLSPIPLTPEILEKNDFKKFNFHDIPGQHQWSWWRDTLTSVTLWCRELNDDARDGWMIRIDSRHSTCCCKIDYIHQLQHALRLCGIDKTIEL